MSVRVDPKYVERVGSKVTRGIGFVLLDLRHFSQDLYQIKKEEIRILRYLLPLILFSLYFMYKYID